MRTWHGARLISALILGVGAVRPLAAQAADTLAPVAVDRPAPTASAPFRVEADGRLADRPPRPVVVRLVADSPQVARDVAAAPQAATSPAPARAPARPAPSRNAARPRTHTVAPGETLFAIARRYDVPVAELRRLNGLRSDTIRVGQVLRLPPPENPPR